MRLRLTLTLLSCGLLLGCGTTKWTDTTRTATEQLLISDSMDRAVSRIDFRALAGKKVFVDDTPLKGVTDTAYLASVIRQHLLASGGKLQETKDKAEYVVEVRAGAVGTDHDDLLVGVPALTVPTVVPVPGIPTQIPEIPFVKRTNQRAVAKIAVFVYNRKTGRILWQSGIVPDESRTKALWVFGRARSKADQLTAAPSLPAISSRSPWWISTNNETHTTSRFRSPSRHSLSSRKRSSRKQRRAPANPRANRRNPPTERPKTQAVPRAR